MRKVWSDAAIVTRAEDAFERAAYAQQAARLIAASHSWDDSVVFGLTGPWGSGKTSMLAMIVEELEESAKEWRVARFTPWATGDVGGLLEDFYATLSGTLPKKRGRKVRSALGTLAQVTAPAANALPWGGQAVAAAVDAAGDALKKRPSWDQAFRVAAEELREVGSPVLLVADDIDRLQPDELFALLKVVRLLGRFPGVHYLLAYDESTLYQSLSGPGRLGADDGVAARFMEKIVQYPLVVPPLTSTQLLSRLDDGLDLALADTGRTQMSSTRLNHLSGVFLSQLATPRAIDRYLAQLRHHLPLVDQEEIDDEDVVVLTLLRTCFPTLYTQLPRWRNELLTGRTGDLKRGGSRVEYEEFAIEPLLDGIPKRAHQDARSLLHDLFPKVASPDRRSPYSSSRRVSDERYFAMGIPLHDVSDVMVSEAVREAAKGAGRKLQALLTLSEADRAQLVLEKAQQITVGANGATFPDSDRLSLAAVVVDALLEMAQTEGRFTNPKERATGWVASIIGGLSPAVPASSVSRVLAGASRLADAIEILSYSEQWDPALGWLAEVESAYGDLAAEAFMAHLRTRDAAEVEDGPGWFLHHLRRIDQIDRLAKAIADGVAQGEISLADVAARFVRMSRMAGVPGASWQLREFDQESFEQFAPALDDEWYRQEKVEVDPSDLSWANRRKFAAGRATRPSR